MNIPKPSAMPNHTLKSTHDDPLKKELEAAFGITLHDGPAAKKAFVRKPHLTDRPLKNNSGLLELKQSLTNPNK